MKDRSDARQKNQLWNKLKKQRALQLMVWFGLLFLIVFRILPISGMQLAFKELLPGLTIADSPWVKFKHFENFFYSGAFSQVMKNTITLSFGKILFGFPIPILLALLLNELNSQKTKTLVQGITYLPYFLSWVVIFGVMNGILAFQGGAINDVLMILGFIKEPIHFLGTPSYFKPIMILLDIWKEMGWGAIIYTAAIAGIDSQLYEAATVDGAGKLRRVLSITIPLIMPTIIIMLILRVGNILDAGFDQILVFRNPITHDVANIVDVYVYEIGLRQGRFGYATAVGFFKSIVSFILIFLTNKAASRYEMGLW